MDGMKKKHLSDETELNRQILQLSQEVKQKQDELYRLQSECTKFKSNLDYVHAQHQLNASHDYIMHIL